MKQRAIGLVLCLAALSLPVALAFQSNSSSVGRSFNRTVALTNSQIIVTVNYTNGRAGTARGLFYSDQVPSSLVVTTLSVTLNGRTVTNYLFEAGQDGDVYAGCTPYRWVLEQPTNFAEANPIPVRAPVRIVYAITTSVSNSYNLQQFSWAGLDAVMNTNFFGYSETNDQQTVIFTTMPAGVSVSMQCATNGFLICLNGLPGTNYVLQASTNLQSWMSLVTNVSPFQYTDTNQIACRRRFYRAKLF
jgi:hypothetical protein